MACESCMLHCFDSTFFYRVLRKCGLSKYAGLKDTLVEMYTRGIDSPYLMATLIDIYEEELENNTAEPRTLDKAIEVSLILIWLGNTRAVSWHGIRDEGSMVILGSRIRSLDLGLGSQPLVLDRKKILTNRWSSVFVRLDAGTKPGKNFGIRDQSFCLKMGS